MSQGSNHKQVGKVLIADSQLLFAEAVAAALEAQGFRRPSCVASSDDLFASLSRSGLPDFLLLDLTIERGAGVQIGRQVLEEDPSVKVMALAAHPDRVSLRAALDAGFAGYLTKDMKMSGLVNAIRMASAGEERVVSGSLSSIDDDPITQEADRLIGHLTKRERQILSALARGRSSAQIAEGLSISPNTVRTHVGSILAKLNVHSRLEAAAFAVRHGLADPEPFGRRTA
jgi:two-component system nitrate/nitrite response regulator NarL